MTQIGDNPERRWKAVLVYKGPSHPIVKIVHVEEIQDLQEVVEHGPDWNDLLSFTVYLNRRSR